MKLHVTISVIVLVLLGFVLWWWLPPRRSSQKPQFSPDPVAKVAEKPLLGDALLTDYLANDGNLQQDLNLLSRLVQSYFTLVKTHEKQPISVNADLVDALLGKNPYRQVFLKRDHPALNAQGQLIDRFGSPLFVHATGSGLLEIRSAGPDKQLWTEDDLTRHPDGRFESGSPTQGTLYQR